MFSEGFSLGSGGQGVKLSISGQVLEAGVRQPASEMSFSFECKRSLCRHKACRVFVDKDAQLA